MEEKPNPGPGQEQKAPARRMVGFLRDAQGDWIAHLECGHTQHVRHNPPWADRDWVTTEAGRASRIGAKLPCRRCAELDPYS